MLFTALCLVSLLTVQQEPLRPKFLPADEIVGRAWFEVLSGTDEEVWVTPKVVVLFGLRPITSTGTPIPKGLAQCTVIRRYLDVGAEKANVDLTVTMLKCGEYEYGIRDLGFAQDKDKNDK